MTTNPIFQDDFPPEILFLQSPAGGAILILLALAAFAAVLWWARRPGHPDRLTAVWAAAGTSLLMTALSIVAVAAGWWRGAFVSIPILVLAAIYGPFSVAGYTVWLGIYRWLAGHSKHAFWVYALIVLAFIPVVLLVDPIQMQRGQFTMGSGYTVWTDVLMGQVVMWSPVLFYEAIRRMDGQKVRPRWTN